MNSIETQMAEQIISYMADMIEPSQESETPVRPCCVVAEVMKRVLMSDDLDCCHVNWIELKERLDKILTRELGEV